MLKLLKMGKKDMGLGQKLVRALNRKFRALIDLSSEILVIGSFSTSLAYLIFF